jgi:hypothetical protein
MENKNFVSEEFHEFRMKLENLIKGLFCDACSKKEWLTKEEVMRMLDCSERTLFKLRDDDRLPYSNPTGGSKFLYLRADVEALLKEHYFKKPK